MSARACLTALPQAGRLLRMTKVRGLISFPILAFVLAGCASAPHPREQPKEWHPAINMLLKYDANHDGSITRAEMNAGLRADFAKADYKHKGCLDDDEARAVNEQRWQDDQAAATPLVDFSQNGCISFEEFAAAPRSLFDQLDTDGKGILTPKELHPVVKPVRMPMINGNPDL
jgi:Ca2+-binding EF-hand superfamily protein